MDEVKCCCGKLAKFRLVARQNDETPRIVTFRCCDDVMSFIIVNTYLTTVEIDAL